MSSLIRRFKKMQDKQKRTRAKGRALTKKMIEEMGVRLEIGEDKANPTVLRTRKGVTRKIKPCPYTINRIFGKPMTYMYVGWSYNGKAQSFSYSRVVYAWFNGDIPAGDYDIDHIDNNTLNNNPENLRLLSHKENIQKRPNHGCNQYKNARTMGIYKK